MEKLFIFGPRKLPLPPRKFTHKQQTQK